MAVLAGSASTTLFVVSYLPMLIRAVRTRDLRSYSRSSLVIANVGNVVQAGYVISLPAGPLWFLHSFYLVASALMLGLHLRHGAPAGQPDPADQPDQPDNDLRPGSETTPPQPAAANPHPTLRSTS